MNSRCRFCGNNCSDSDLVADINNVQIKSLFEKITGISLNDDKSLPQRICRLCNAHIYLLFECSIKWKKIQKYEWIRGSKTTLDVQQFTTTTNMTAGSSKTYNKRFKPNKSSFLEALELFDFKDYDNLQDLKAYPQINVDLKYISKDGEIHQDWITRFATGDKLWENLKFNCCGCKKDVISLLNIISHAKEEKLDTFRYHCPVTKKFLNFDGLVSLVNYAISQTKYIAFICIACNKVFRNIPSLLLHYEASHLNFTDHVICIKCSKYFLNINNLQLHKPSHDLEEKSGPSTALNLSDTDETFQSSNIQHHLFASNIKRESTSSIDTIPARKRQPSIQMDRCKMFPAKHSTVEQSSDFSLRATRSSENLNPNRNYHPRTRKFLEDSDRITFPCPVEGCGRILMSAIGFEYHKLVHQGSKPFKCRCGRTFRTIYALKTHQSKYFHESE